MEEGSARTVLLGDGRGEDRYLRVTWHPDSETFVFSHWNGPVCAASTPVRLSDASRLLELLSAALAQAGAGRADDTMVMQAVGTTGSGVGARGRLTEATAVTGVARPARGARASGAYESRQ